MISCNRYIQRPSHTQAEPILLGSKRVLITKASGESNLCALPNGG